MTVKYKPYPTYKSSGIEWLGDIPKNWTVKKLNYLVTKVGSGKTPSGGASNYLDSGVMLIRSQNVYDDGMRLDDVVYIDEDTHAEMSSSQVEYGDVLLNITGASIGRCAIYDRNDEANVNQHVCINRITSTSAIPEFVQAVLISTIVKGQILSLETGSSREGLNFQQVRGLVIPCPPLKEQKSITDCLDSSTSKIDTLISKQRELIERLQEKRRALISRCVTRGLPPEAAQAAGLDPHPKLKPSGVEWLGDVPDHWKVIPLGYLISIQGGSTPSTSNEEYWDGEVPWVSPKDMKRSLISDSIDHVTQVAVRETGIRMIETDAVLVVIRGMILAHTFPVGITVKPVTINQDMKALISCSRLLPQFLFWKLTGLSDVFVSLANESAHGTRKIDTETITRFSFSFPSMKEQTAITDYLNEETAHLDSLTTKVKQAIDRLQEYRTALITAAVTGKIDVREVTQ